MRTRNTAEGPVHVSAVVASMGPLFDVPPDMVRHPDHATSIEAARGLLPSLSALQQQVLDAFRDHGAMTDAQLERLPQFSRCSPSTIRKRRSELTTRELVASVGMAPNAAGSAMMTVWALCTSDTERAPCRESGQ